MVLCTYMVIHVLQIYYRKENKPSAVCGWEYLVILYCIYLDIKIQTLSPDAEQGPRKSMEESIFWMILGIYLIYL